MSEGSFSQAGFSYQNHLAALKILDLLDISSDMLFVELENFKKGAHIDDIIVTRRESIEYFQVKWSADENNAYTLYNIAFEKQKDDKDTLWTKLKNGYQKKLTGGKAATITLYTTRPAGTNIQTAHGLTKSLTQLNTFHKRFITAGNLSLAEVEGYLDFKPVLEKLQAAIELTDAGFEDFFRTLRFKFNAPDQENLERLLDARADSLGLERVQIDTLLRLVVSWSISAKEITKDVLLKELGIIDRTRDQLSHVFKIDEQLYIENAALFAQLDKALATLPGGHILVEGVPGAGKSTALTKYFLRNPAVKFAYYCFIPDDTTGADLRLRGDYFLKSLCVAIETGFPSLELPVRYSEDYEDKLAQYIQVLGRLDEKVILLIDGLDHVDRQQASISDPLTSHIFSSLPGNIFFVISSQYKEALPLSIRAAVNGDPRRLLTVDRFDEAKVRDYVVKKGLVLTDELVSLLHIRSEGIPLYLYYIAAQLQDIEPNEQEAFIQTLPVLAEGRINTYHEGLYLQIESDDIIVWIMAVLAYRKEYTTVEVLKTLLSHAGKVVDVLQLNQKLIRFKYLLKEKDGISYSIFHNSFRELILSKTTGLKSAISEALIAYYREDIYDDEAFRNYFLHLFALKKHKEITATVTDAWITEAWARYRSLEAITKNIDIAWQAAAERVSISEFVRIGFLKHQVSLAKFNLDNLDFEDSTYFLSANLGKESLRTVWDGEFSLIGRASYFNYYAVKYAEQTGHLISTPVAQQFFNNFNSSVTGDDGQGRDAPDFNFYFQARSLYLDPQELLAEITERQNRLTKTIFKNLIRFLARQQKVLHLLALKDVQSANLKSFILAEICLALYQKRSPDAIQFLEELVFTDLEPDEQVAFFNRIADHLPAAEVIRRFGTLRIEPFIANEIVSDAHGHPLEAGFMHLLEDLKAFYLLDETNYAVYELRLSAIRSYPKVFFYALSKAARLWADQKSGRTTPDLMRELKQVLFNLNVDPDQAALIRSGYDTRSFIIYEIHRFQEPVFRLLNELCSDTDMAELCRYWLQQHLSRGFKSHLSNLALVAVIRGRKALSQEVLALLHQAEQLAREDHSTSSLVDRLTAVGMKYGEAGLFANYNRIYVELLSMACGVAHRKDYQFTEILPVLTELHKIEPELTLGRFAELYYLLFQMKDAGNPRMLHICLAYMIRFAIKLFPELGFRLLLKDDLFMDRDEAMDIIIGDFIKEVDIAFLPFAWAVITSLNKWENFSKTDDNYLRDLYESFFKRAAQGPDKKLLKHAYQQLYQIFDLEHGQAYSILPINRIIEGAGVEAGYLLHPALPDKEPTGGNPDFEQTKTIEKFKITPRKLTTNELAQMASKDFNEVYQYVADYVLAFEINKISPFWSQHYHRTRENLEEWFSGLAPEQQDLIKGKLVPLKRIFIGRKAALGRLKLSPAILENELRQLATDIDVLFPEAGFATQIGSFYEYSTVATEMHSATQQYRNQLYGAIKDEEVLQISESTPISLIDNWLNFGRRYFGKEAVVKMLIRLSRRYFGYDENKAKELLRDALHLFGQLPYRDKDTESEIVSWAYECLPDEANYLLLHIFCSGRLRSTSDIPYDIHKTLLPWLDSFHEPGFYKEYYTANFQYNIKLASGLPEPELDTAFITGHEEKKTVPEIVTDYLISLFDYPLVKIRQLALTALFDLFSYNDQLLVSMAQTRLSSYPANQIEHFLILLHSLYYRTPQEITALVCKMDWIFNTRHFNIQQTFADLVLHISGEQEMPEALVSRAQNIHRQPLIAIPAIIPGIPLRQRTVAMGYYQASLIGELRDARQSTLNFSNELNQLLAADHYDSMEAATVDASYSRHYNKNANWDQVEINSPSYQTIQDKLNRLFVHCIAAGEYTNEFVDRIKYEFRLYDPTDAIYPRSKIPAYINWKGKKTKGADFVSFKDKNELFKSLLSRFKDQVTIYEKGYQIFDNYPDYLSTHFELTYFLADKRSGLEKIKSTLVEYPASFGTDNLYRDEMVHEFRSIDGSDAFEGRIYPLIGKSDKNFRHKQEDALAVLLPHIAQQLHLSPGELPGSWETAGGTAVTTFIEWQGALGDGMNRRRFEPFAQGCTLNINTEMLKAHIKLADKDLYACIELRRSADKYKEEKDMDWEEHVFIKKINL